jgi:hypothetical protein
MLQILLAFLALTLVSATGYGLYEQMALQQIMTEQRENIRRIDLAADGIQSRLVNFPGMNGYFAPGAVTGGTWARIPDGIGGNNKTVSGVDFLYCPVASASNEGSVASYGLNSDKSYSAILRTNPDGNGQVVVGSSGISLHSSVAALNPVAIIVSAAKSRSNPPSCEDVQIVNGKPYVPGGLARIISKPSQVASYGKNSFEFGPSSNVSFDDAVDQWISSNPSSVNFSLAGNMTFSSQSDLVTWGKFLSFLSSTGAKVSINGNGFTITAPTSDLFIPSSLSLANVGIIGPRVVIGTGDELIVKGSTIKSSGNLETLRILEGGKLSSWGSSIGDITGSDRSNQPSIISVGASFIFSDDGSVSGGSKVAASSTGSCWASIASDKNFTMSDDGIGSVSSPDSDLVTNEEDQTNYDLAKKTNFSKFGCL